MAHSSRSLAKSIGIVILGIIMVGAISADFAECADTYPEKPISAYVGYPAGGGTDTIARTLAPILEENLGQPLVIINLPGAHSAQAGTQVQLAKKDGYTVFFATEGMAVWQVTGITKKLNYKDFDPIALMGVGPATVAVNAKTPWNTVEELFEDAKKRPGEITAGTAGPFTTSHVCLLILKHTLGLKFHMIPYVGGSAAVLAAVKGEVKVLPEMTTQMYEMYKAGKMKFLAQFTKESMVGLEKIPTLGEKYPKLRPYLPYGPYFGLFVAKGTSEKVKFRLIEAMGAALKDPRWTKFADNRLIARLDLVGGLAEQWIDRWISNVAWILYDMGEIKQSPEKFGIPRIR
jgi:tripartite-type tricarboxylate transporter receptor subunit TctC